MEEKIRFTSTPFPLQTIFGEKLFNFKGDSKFSKKFPIKDKGAPYSTDRKSLSKTEEINTKAIPERKVSRKIIRDFRIDSNPMKTSAPQNFYKTYS